MDPPTKNRLNILIGLKEYLFLLLVFFLPIFTFPLIAEKYDLAKTFLVYFFTAVLLFLTGLEIFWRKKIILPEKKITYLLIVFLLWLFVSSLFSIMPLVSFFGLGNVNVNSFCHFLLLLIFFFIAFDLFSQKKFLNKFFTYLTTSAFLVAIFGLWQFFQNYFVLKNLNYRLLSTIGEANRAALFLILTLPPAFFLFTQEKNRLFKLFLFAINLVILLALYLTFTRSVWLLLLIFLPIIIYRIKLPKIYWLLSFILIILFFTWQGKNFTQKLSNVVYDLNTGKKGSINIRIDEIKNGWTIAVNQFPSWRFFIGTGPRTVVYSYLKNQPINLLVSPSQRFLKVLVIRNQFVDLFVNIGFLGLLIYLFFIGFIFKTVFAGKKNNLTFTCFFSWLLIFLTSFFYYQTIITSIYFWIFSAAIFSQTNSKKILWVYSLVLPASCWLAAFLIILATAGILTAEIFASQGKLNQAIKLNPYNNSYYLLMAETYFQEKNYNESIVWGQKAIKVNKLNAKNYQFLAKAYYTKGVYFDKKDHQTALDFAHQWQFLDPANPNVYDNLGLIYLDLGRLDLALENFQTAINLNPEGFVFYLHAGEATKQLGQKEQAINYYYQAVKLNPQSEFAQQEVDKLLQDSYY